jgi:hypothetical protein
MSCSVFTLLLLLLLWLCLLTAGGCGDDVLLLLLLLLLDWSLLAVCHGTEIYGSWSPGKSKLRTFKGEGWY